jgi:hypothetical protein
MNTSAKITKDDLDAAQELLQVLNERDSSDTSGNPEKYHTRINMARAEVERITEQLKRQGDLPYSENELMGQKLDSAFPKAQSNDIVQFEGNQFQLKFYPTSKSRSGKTVQSWRKEWVQLS